MDTVRNNLDIEGTYINKQFIPIRNTVSIGFSTQFEMLIP